MERDETKTYKFKYSVQDALKTAQEDCRDTIKTQNDLWYGCTRLIITLASTFLVLSAGFLNTKQSVPLSDLPQEVKWHLAAGLSSYLLAIIFGIITEIDGAYFNGKMADMLGTKSNEYIKALSHGKTELEEVVNASDTFHIKPHILFGVLEIVSFFIALICTLIFCLSSFIGFPKELLLSIWLLFVIFVGLILRLYRDRIFKFDKIG